MENEPCTRGQLACFPGMLRRKRFLLNPGLAEASAGPAENGFLIGMVFATACGFLVWMQDDPHDIFVPVRTRPKSNAQEFGYRDKRHSFDFAPRSHHGLKPNSCREHAFHCFSHYARGQVHLQRANAAAQSTALPVASGHGTPLGNTLTIATVSWHHDGELTT